MDAYVLHLGIIVLMKRKTFLQVMEDREQMKLDRDIERTNASMSRQVVKEKDKELASANRRIAELEEELSVLQKGHPKAGTFFPDCRV